MAGREAESVAMIAQVVEDLKKQQAEHDAGKVQAAFTKFDKDNSETIDKDELSNVIE
jgi:Ca2+-binding EF-hand superfamily protein